MPLSARNSETCLVARLAPPQMLCCSNFFNPSQLPRLVPLPSCQLAGAPALATLIPWIIYAHFFCFCLGVAPYPSRLFHCCCCCYFFLFFFFFAFWKAKGVVCNFFKNKIFFISLLRWFSCNLRKTNKKERRRQNESKPKPKALKRA